MKTKRIFFFFFSLLFILNAAQKQDSVKVKFRYEPNFLVGFDLLNGGMSFFTDRKVFQGFISSKIKNNIHAVVDAGFEKNRYQKNGYDADVSGPFIKLGAFYMLSKDPENEFNGFYGGGKVAGSFYKQEYRAVPVRGFGESATSVAFPESAQSSYWLEGVVGGRVKLFDSNFYIDVNVQPHYLLYSTKQEEIQPMIVPGFGRSSTKFGVGFSWNVAYMF
ncbi:DUF6048 family protein [Chryseobacterium sp.]|uniref:DUF6048 family protein n=1 Tax=Chryseobacterium sp. TaxID=1871047 RepID=UPI0011CC8CBE|nr:DUF6048 family protein [Chryseobacterium sp.]TXF77277.1 hypothetical protein FUA25_04885 [Chryseobacterium sp.]